MLKKTSAAAGLVIATAAGAMFIDSPAFAQPGLAQGWQHRHYSRFHFHAHHRSWNGNRNRPKIYIRIYVYNKNNNAAVVARRNEGDDRFARRDLDAPGFARQPARTGSDGSAQDGIGTGNAVIGTTGRRAGDPPQEQD